MNLDLQEPPRAACPFLMSIENEAFPEGIKGGRRIFFFFLKLSNIKAKKQLFFWVLCVL